MLSDAKRMTFGSMTGRITEAELRAIERIPVETAEDRARRRAKPVVLPPPRDAKVHPRQLAYSLFVGTRARWPEELRRYQAVETGWKQHLDLVRFDGNAHVVVGDSPQAALYAWLSWRAVTELEQQEDLSASSLVHLPNIQVTSGTSLRDRLFARDRDTVTPHNWVNHDSDLVVIVLEPGTPKHDGVVSGIIDVLNRCEMLRIPLWFVSHAKWRYGKKHPAHHERIDDWLENAREFDYSRTDLDL